MARGHCPRNIVSTYLSEESSHGQRDDTEENDQKEASHDREGKAHREDRKEEPIIQFVLRPFRSEAGAWGPSASIGYGPRTLAVSCFAPSVASLLDKSVTQKKLYRAHSSKAFFRTLNSRFRVCVPSAIQTCPSCTVHSSCMLDCASGARARLPSSGRLITARLCR